MSTLASIVERFPAHELAIRRICTLDPDFKGICEDYNEAASAMTHWGGADNQLRASEYRQIMRDLEAEIIKVLDAHAVRHSVREMD